MDINLLLAENLRKIREEKQLTLDGAAQATGVSRSMLSQLERGNVNPTITVLWKIANGYKVPFGELLEDRRVGTVVLSEPDPLVEDGGRYLNYPAFSYDAHRRFEILRIVIVPGGGLEAEPHLAHTEEYITVFSGTVVIMVDGTRHMLRLGESLRFQADVAHSYHNEGGETCTLSMILYYGEGGA